MKWIHVQTNQSCVFYHAVFYSNTYCNFSYVRHQSDSQLSICCIYIATLISLQSVVDTSFTEFSLHSLEICPPLSSVHFSLAVCVVCLSSLCRRHKSIIIMSIHQPRYSIFKLVDRLTLLSQGNMVYHGDATQALQYFNELGESS